MPAYKGPLLRRPLATKKGRTRFRSNGSFPHDLYSHKVLASAPYISTPTEGRGLYSHCPEIYMARWSLILILATIFEVDCGGGVDTVWSHSAQAPGWAICGVGGVDSIWFHSVQAPGWAAVEVRPRFHQRRNDLGSPL